MEKKRDKFPWIIIVILLAMFLSYNLALDYLAKSVRADRMLEAYTLRLLEQNITLKTIVERDDRLFELDRKMLYEAKK